MHALYCKHKHLSNSCVSIHAALGVKKQRKAKSFRNLITGETFVIKQNASYWMVFVAMSLNHVFYTLE